MPTINLGQLYIPQLPPQKPKGIPIPINSRHYKQRVLHLIVLVKEMAMAYHRLFILLFFVFAITSSAARTTVFLSGIKLMRSLYVECFINIILS